MNIIQTASEPNAVVRDLVKTHNKLYLKKGLIDAGLANSFSTLSKLRDEILLWDKEGNVFLVPVTNGVWFDPVSRKRPYDPSNGILIASLKDTKVVRYNPMFAHKKVFGFLTEYVSNNTLHFYRSEHEDCEPFLSISPLWLLLPEFRELLERFPEGDYSSLESVTEIVEPSPNSYNVNKLLTGAVVVEGKNFSPQPELARVIRVKNSDLLV